MVASLAQRAVPGTRKPYHKVQYRLVSYRAKDILYKNFNITASAIRTLLAKIGPSLQLLAFLFFILYCTPFPDYYVMYILVSSGGWVKI